MYTRFMMLAAATCTALCAAPLAAQGSPFVPLDDPRLPRFEMLVARGAVDDPSPFVRPFRRSDALRVLAAADSGAATADGRMIRGLRAAFSADDGVVTARDTVWSDRWRLEPRVGGQAYTDAVRDALRTGGPGGVRPYGDLRLEAVTGPFALVSRPAIETRLIADPEWQGRKDLDVTGRLVEAYASASFRQGHVFFGQLDWNWGPIHEQGLGLSGAGYARTSFGFDVGTRTLRLQAQASTLRPGTDSLGTRVDRFFFAHRLVLQPSRRWTVALWEMAVVSGASSQFDGRYRNPLSLLVLANQYGQGDESNVVLGADVGWRPSRRLGVQAQILLDDLQYQNRGNAERFPDRYGVTVSAFGPLGGTLGWQASLSQVASLTYQTSDVQQSFTDGRTGLARNFPDNRQVALRVSWPVRSGWLLTPEAVLLQQGEGRLDRPFPADRAEAGQLPQILIGTVERTLRFGLGVAGREGPLDLQGSLGFHDVRNAGNVAGVSRREFVLRAQGVLRVARGGRLD